MSMWKTVLFLDLDMAVRHAVIFRVIMKSTFIQLISLLFISTYNPGCRIPMESFTKRFFLKKRCRNCSVTNKTFE